MATGRDKLSPGLSTTRDGALHPCVVRTRMKVGEGDVGCGTGVASGKGVTSRKGVDTEIG